MKNRRTLIIVAVVTVVIAVIAVIMMTARCQSTPLPQPVTIDTTLLRNGDIIFRNGLSTESRLVTGLSKGKYSHVGMAYKYQGRWCVIHAVPGEAPKGQPEYLKCEPLALFLAADRACAADVRRVPCDSIHAARAAEKALQKVREHVVFDNRYDDSDTTQLYCTELVSLAYRSQGIDLVGAHRTEVPYPGTSGRFIFPEDLWQKTISP